MPGCSAAWERRLWHLGAHLQVPSLGKPPNCLHRVQSRRLQRVNKHMCVNMHVLSMYFCVSGSSLPDSVSLCAPSCYKVHRRAIPSPVSSAQSQCLAGDSWERIYGVCVEGLYLGDLEVTFVPGGMVWSCVGRLTPGGSRQGPKGGAGAGFPGAGPLQLNHKHPLGPPQAKGKGKISDWRHLISQSHGLPQKGYARGCWG